MKFDWPCFFLLTGACVKNSVNCVRPLWKFPIICSVTLSLIFDVQIICFPRLTRLSRWSLGFELPWVKKCLAQTILIFRIVPDLVFITHSDIGLRPIVPKPSVLSSQDIKVTTINWRSEYWISSEWGPTVGVRLARPWISIRNDYQFQIFKKLYLVKSKLE